MDSNNPHIRFYSFSTEVEPFNEFLDRYRPVKLVIPPDNPIRNSRIPSQRSCRFCKKKYPEVKFKKKAHVIPESLGNRFLISDDECDTCNEYFGKNENDLNNWLGIIRTMNGTKGKKGVPNFRSVNERLTAELVNFQNVEGTKVAFKDKEAFSYDQGTGQTTFTFEKGPYTPVKVYKAFLKMALCFIPAQGIPNYLPAIKFLLGDDDNYGFKKFARVISHELPMLHQLNRPCAMLFERISDNDQIPEHFFSLYYEQFIYSFPLPLNLTDIKNGIYKDGEMTLIYPPPVLFEKPNVPSLFNLNFLDFGDSIRKIAEKAVITLNTNLQSFEKLVAIDPETGETQSAEMKDVKVAGMIFVPEGTVLKIGEKFKLP